MNATRWDKTKTSKMLMCESMVINSVGLNCCRSAVIQIMIEIKTGVLNSTSTILTRIEFAHYHCKPIDLNKFIHRFKWKWKMRKRNQIQTALFLCIHYAYVLYQFLKWSMKDDNNDNNCGISCVLRLVYWNSTDLFHV